MMMMKPERLDWSVFTFYEPRQWHTECFPHQIYLHFSFSNALFAFLKLINTLPSHTLLLLGSTREEYNTIQLALFVVLPNKSIYPEFQTLLLLQLASWHIHTIESLTLPYVSSGQTALFMLNSCLLCPHVLPFSFLTLPLIQPCQEI